jgi:hypothetical protein
MAAAASTIKSGCNQETKMDAIRNGKAITAVMMRDMLGVRGFQSFVFGL